jgi:hypothetical protein
VNLVAFVEDVIVTEYYTGSIVGGLVGGGSFFHINPLNAELNLICHLLALLGAHHILHVSRIRVKGVCIVSR